MAKLKVQMRINIFTDFNVALNPYIILFKEALESQGLAVKIERNLSLFWLVFKSKSCDCIHLHWLKYQYSPSKKNEKTKLLNKLLEIRIVRIIFDLFSLFDFVLSLLLAKTAGKIIVFTVHDLHDYGIKPSRLKLQKIIARKIVFRYSDKIHVHNNYTGKIIEQKYNRKTGIYVIPHGNYIGYYSNNINKKDAKQKLGLPDNTFVYLFLGLIRPYKGVEDLISAFKKLKSQKLRLLIVGRVFGKAYYEQELRKFCISDARIDLVTMFIADDAIKVYLKACDIFVLPYKDITTSGAAYLALSFGRPLIAPNIASFPEIITASSGILYNATKPVGLVTALKEARTQEWSENKILEYAHKYDWNKLGPQLSGLYRKQVHNKV